MASQDLHASACKALKWTPYFAGAEIAVSICGMAWTAVALDAENYVKNDADVIEGKLPKLMLIGILVAFVANFTFGVYLLLGNGPVKRSLLWKGIVCTLIAVFWDAIANMARAQEKA